MMYYRLRNGLLPLPTTRQMQGYLEARGWTLQPSQPTRFWVYAPPNGDDDGVNVPTQPTFRDYTLRMAECLFDVAEIERRSVHAVLEDVQAILISDEGETAVP